MSFYDYTFLCVNKVDSIMLSKHCQNIWSKIFTYSISNRNEIFKKISDCVSGQTDCVSPEPKCSLVGECRGNISHFVGNVETKGIRFVNVETKGIRFVNVEKIFYALMSRKHFTLCWKCRNKRYPSNLLTSKQRYFIHLRRTRSFLNC
jgi:hypothetical protein